MAGGLSIKWLWDSLARRASQLARSLGPRMFALEDEKGTNKKQQSVWQYFLGGMIHKHK